MFDSIRRHWTRTGMRVDDHHLLLSLPYFTGLFSSPAVASLPSISWSLRDHFTLTRGLKYPDKGKGNNQRIDWFFLRVIFNPPAAVFYSRMSFLSISLVKERVVVFAFSLNVKTHAINFPLKRPLLFWWLNLLSFLSSSSTSHGDISSPPVYHHTMSTPLFLLWEYKRSIILLLYSMFNPYLDSTRHHFFFFFPFISLMPSTSNTTNWDDDNNREQMQQNSGLVSNSKRTNSFRGNTGPNHTLHVQVSNPSCSWWLDCLFEVHENESWATQSGSNNMSRRVHTNNWWHQGVEHVKTNKSWYGFTCKSIVLFVPSSCSRVLPSLFSSFTLLPAFRVISSWIVILISSQNTRAILLLFLSTHK